MSEKFLNEVPDRNRVVGGLTLDQFLALTDEELEAFHARLSASMTDRSEVSGRILTEEEQEALDLTITDEWQTTFGFMDFLSYRRHGVPDRRVSEADMEDYLRDLVAYRLAQDPNYGVEPEGFRQLPNRQKDAVLCLWGYFRDARDAYEPLVIDDHSLGHMDFEINDIDKLIANGVIVPVGESLMGGNQYTFTDRYLARWLVVHYGPPEEI